MDVDKLGSNIIVWAEELGFQDVGFSNIDLSQAEQRLISWLEKDYHGDMDWMQKHGLKRSRPQELVANTRSIISVRMDYLPVESTDPIMVLNHPELAYVSRYALGRDYHKVMRKRLQKLATKITKEIGEFGYRVFVDSAPVLEKPIAVKAGLGWMGKHTNILNRKAGSWFFLGEIYTDLPLTSAAVSEDHCGECTACIDVCPTQAIIAPYTLDARLCISYLTIEHKGAIPEELRPLIGNRIYGCDDCQLICPWNRFANHSELDDFAARHQLDSATLVSLFEWTEEEFLEKLQGSPIRRIGFERWQRNLAVALGNAPKSSAIIKSLRKQLPHSSELVKEHIQWSLRKLC
ncbi:MAG: tRNA epoxyqueuosine(34) reductase QueG [Thiotrichaceae bacterium]